MTDTTVNPSITTPIFESAAPAPPVTEPTPSPFSSPFAADPKPEPKPTGINADVIAILTEAKERLAVHALSDVGYCIGSAIKMLGG
jgi:hypothetical protein